MNINEDFHELINENISMPICSFIENINVHYLSLRLITYFLKFS